MNILSKKSPLVIEFWPYALDKFNAYNLLKKNLIKLNYTNCYNLNLKSYIKDLTEGKLDDLYFGYKSRILNHTNLLFFKSFKKSILVLHKFGEKTKSEKTLKQIEANY